MSKSQVLIKSIPFVCQLVTVLAAAAEMPSGLKSQLQHIQDQPIQIYCREGIETRVKVGTHQLAIGVDPAVREVDFVEYNSYTYEDGTNQPGYELINLAPTILEEEKNFQWTASGGINAKPTRADPPPFTFNLSINYFQVTRAPVVDPTNSVVMSGSFSLEHSITVPAPSFQPTRLVLSGKQSFFLPITTCQFIEHQQMAVELSQKPIQDTGECPSPLPQGAQCHELRCGADCSWKEPSGEVRSCRDYGC